MAAVVVVSEFLGEQVIDFFLRFLLNLLAAYEDGRTPLSFYEESQARVVASAEFFLCGRAYIQLAEALDEWICALCV